MSERLRLGIVGCGGMGHRHLYGLAELDRAGLSPFELVGVCDPVADNARSLAEQARELLGVEPAVVGDLEGLEKVGGVRAIDVCTLPNVHHVIGEEGMQRGWDVMCEKPLGLTARACARICRAVEETGRILSVAENYRRDPLNRLGKALLEAGVIGESRSMIHHTLGGGDQMLISVWRHQKNASGLLLDVGVHFADIIEYYLGAAETVYAQTRLYEKVRRNPMAGKGLDEDASPAGVYGKWQRELPAEFEATAEDAAYATITFANGAVCQYVEDHAVRGRGAWQRAIYGGLGSVDLPGDRSGRRLKLFLEGREPIDDGRLLEMVPEFRLDEATAALFGGERLYEYQFPFAETDRKLLAVEYAEFGTCVETGRQPEVDALQGARSVGLCYALMESQVAGRAVRMEEVLEDRLNDYQDEINASLGL